MNTSGKLVKMVIDSYANRDFSDKKDKIKKFVISVNPESFSKNFKIEHETKRAHGNHGTSGKFNSTAPEEFKIEFILDGTNTIQGYEYDGLFKETADDSNVNSEKFPGEDLVEKQLEKFLNTVYKMDGEIHRPRFCKIFWGGEKHLFQGILNNLDINYSLFHSSGKPLRIKINATFLDYVAKEERERKNRRRSPDLTRIRRLNEGDRLEQMVYDIYGDPKFIVQVAKVNGLTGFRKIKTGTELRFPPLDKTEIT